MRSESVDKRIYRETGVVVDEGSITIFKVSPKEGGCCCTHCWRQTWDYINSNLILNHPVPHEGSALVTVDNANLVLEDHESGPEVIVWVGVGSAIVNLISAIISLLGAIIISRKNEKPSASFVIKRIKYKKGKPQKEILFEIPANASTAILQKLLKDNVKL